jgi:hypothetical protein
MDSGSPEAMDIVYVVKDIVCVGIDLLKDIVCVEKT